MINNIELLAFIRENLSLARTIVIKNENLALTDNALMKAHYGLDSGSDKTKWRYYLNLNGEYHVTDDMMQVKSLDDNELINFTKETLEQHPATKKAYRLGGYYFSRLNAQYPHQSELIQGIINPIPPEESIPADNFQILRYTKEYVHWNETQLIPGLQDDIYKNSYQFYDTEYMYTDNLMAPALIAVMEKCVFEYLLQSRHENRKTRHAHPFYIWSYLQSKGISPIYKDLLNNKQTMWMFRNIDYVLRNLGKEKTFNELIDILLTERNISLSKYDLVLSTEEMADTLKPEPFYFSQRLNLISEKGNGEGMHKVSTVMLKENPESLDNELNYDQFLEKTREESTFGIQGSYPIKVLDSELVDTTNRKAETIYTVLNNELIYLAGNDLYNINLDIEEPRTGIHHRLTVKEAIVFWHHLLDKYRGVDCDTIHKFYYQDVLRITPPKLNALLETGTKPFITEAWCKDVLKTYIPQIRMVSPSVFYENSLSIFNLKWDHQKMYSHWLSIGYYSRRKNAISAMYETGFISLTDETSYAAFIKKFDIDLSTYTKEDYFRLMWELWKRMTGWDQFTHITVGQIQSGMIGLMKFLSSYSVQYVYQTVMEEGWYEGGLDLFTENPMLLSLNNEGQPETENNMIHWLPVHHRAVTNEELEAYYFESSRFEYWDVITDMVEQGKIMQTPLLYDYDPDDEGGGGTMFDGRTVDMSYKLRNYCYSPGYDLDDLIPKGGSRAKDHVLREMIVDSFEGIASVGPWTVTDIVIVNNHLDNQAVATTVDGFDYGQIVNVTPFTKDGVAMNRYYVGFVPALVNANIVKLDLIAKHNETDETIHIRFDYNIVTQQNTWSISFEIPKSIKPETPFEITPTITGLSIGDDTIVEESYIPQSNIADYLTVYTENGKVMGNFTKVGWPTELPVTYVLRTRNSNTDELLSRHYYYMRGLVPSDRYYDPLLDPMFEPTATYNEADLYAVAVENFTVTASNNGWEAVSLYIKKNEDGTYPTDIVKTDYENVVDFLTPTLAETPYTDRVVNGVTQRTFSWLYAIANENVSIPMVLELRNAEGYTVYRSFTYTPEVVNHGTEATYTLYRDSEYKIPINHSSDASLNIDGFGDALTVKKPKGLPVAATGNDTHVILTYMDTTTFRNTVSIPGFIIKTIGTPKSNAEWGVKIATTTTALNGKTLTLYPYGTVKLTPDNFADFDNLEKSDIRISTWGDYPLYTYAFAGTRYAVGIEKEAWDLTAVDVSKFVDSSLDAVETNIYDQVGNAVFTDLAPIVTVGKEKDGNESIPSGMAAWFTVYALGNRKALGEGENTLTAPIYMTFNNSVTNVTKTLQLYADVRIINTPIDRATDEKVPPVLLSGQINHVTPDWVGLPYSLYGNTEEILNEGYFFGTELYSGGAGYQDKPVCVWNGDHSADITMPDAPLTDGKGIRIFNKRTCRSTETALANSSLQDVTYYPYVDYTNDEIERIRVPTLDDFDFTLLPLPNFFKGVRSGLVTLFNNDKVYEKGWKPVDIQLEAFGSDNESDFIITTLNNVALGKNGYSTGFSTQTFNDLPEGKEDYTNAYINFIPAVEGKITLGVLLTVQYDKTEEEMKKVFRYEVEVDVGAKEGTIIFDSSDPVPWWAIGKETYYLTALENVSGDINRKTLSLATVNSTDRPYVTCRAAVNTTLSSQLALAVTVQQSYSSEAITPHAVVSWDVALNGYVTGDPRGSRMYFDLLPINAENLYRIENLSPDSLGFKPDVIFEEMALNQSYTERYVYEQNAKGWVMRSVRLKEQTSWMNHVFEYEEDVITLPALFNNEVQDVSTDMTQLAPDGMYYYLPMYGGRKTGNFDVSIDLLWDNKHLQIADALSLTYRTVRTIALSTIGLKLTYDKFYIGKTNALSGGMINIPTSDINEAVGMGEQHYYIVGKNKQYITLTEDPLAAKVSSDYTPGTGVGITLGATTLYNVAKENAVIESATWVRGYRATQFVPNKDITVKIEYPTANDFNITWLESPLFEYALCTMGYAYDTASATQKGWKCTNNGLTAYGANNQSDVMMTIIEGVTFDDAQVYTFGTKNTVPSDAPTSVSGYQYGYTTFVPATSGAQTIYVSIKLEHESGTVAPFTLSFPLSVMISAREGTISLTDDTAAAWYPIDHETVVLTMISEYSGSIIEEGLSVIAVAADDEAYLTAAIKYSSKYSTDALFIKSLQDFGGEDKHLVGGYTIRVDGYADGDERGYRTYYDRIAVDNTHVYDINNPKPELIDWKADIIFEEMEQFTSYTERYSYLRESLSGWTLKATRIVEEREWMNHVFEYDGLTSTSAQLFTGQKDKVSVDRTINAPADRWFSLPVYGSRKAGEFDVTMEIDITTSQFGSPITSTIVVKQKRKVVDAGINVTIAYDELVIGKTNKITATRHNIPRPDLHAGVTTSATVIAKLGNAAGYFTYSSSPNTLTIDEGYPANANGVMLTFIYPYKGRSSAFPDSSETNNRVYRSEVIIPNEDISDISYPTLEDFDFTPLGGVDFFKGVGSTYVTLYNPSINQDYNWWFSDIKLAVMGTEEQDNTVITTFDGKDITNQAYETGSYASEITNPPAGKERYSLIYTTFVPAKSGAQSFDVIATVSIESSKGTVTKDYTFTMDITVKEQEGEIIYDASEPSPYWLIGTQTYAMTDITGVSGNVQQKSLDYAGVNDEFSTLLTAKTGINNTLTADIAMAVTVKERFADITPRVILAYEVILSGFTSTDPRRVRRYFGNLPIHAENLYTFDDVTLTNMAFKPDIVFETMNLNEVYTERFVYNRDTFGWEVKTARLQEDTNWMAHVFDYDDDTQTDMTLFANTAQNKELDRTIFADDDKYFYMPRYGSRTTGEKDIFIDIVVNNRHLSSKVEVKLSYSAKRNIIDSGIAFNLTHDPLVIGTTVPFDGDISPIPSPDVADYIAEASDNIQLIGSQKAYFTMGRYPYKLTINNDYPLGAANGVMMSATKAFTKEKGGETVLTDTTFRYYRGTYIVADSDISVTADMFEIVPAYNELMTGALCAERFYVKPAADLAALGWKINAIDVKGMRDGTVDKTMFITEKEGFTLSDFYQSRVSSKTSWTVNGVAKDGFVVQFALQHFTGPTVDGKENRSVTIPMVITATKNGKTFTIPFEYVTTSVLVGRDPTVAVQYQSYNYWPVNFKEEKRTTMTISNVPGTYRYSNIGKVPAYGDSASKTSVSLVNNGALNGQANTVFKFTDVSDTDFTYGVKVDYIINASDAELTGRSFYGNYTIEAFRVQDYDSWDLNEFNFDIGQFKPMFVDEFTVLELKALGYKQGLNIGKVELVEYSDDVVQDAITVDGVTINVPLQPTYLLNVTNTGGYRISGAPDSYCFLGFMPKAAGDFTVTLKITLEVGYSSYMKEHTIKVPFKVLEARGHLGLVGDMYWADTSTRTYSLRTVRVPSYARDNVSVPTTHIGIFSTDGTTIALPDENTLTITPATASLTKPLEFFILYEFTDKNMINTPAQKYGVLVRHRFYNNGYEWRQSNFTADATQKAVTTSFNLYKNGAWNNDLEDASTDVPRHVINGLSHEVTSTAGAGIIASIRHYLTNNIPQSFIDVQAIGETSVVGNPTHIFAYNTKSLTGSNFYLYCRSMYVNQKGNLVAEFVYNGGNGWAPLPAGAQFTQQSWKIGDPANGTTPTMEMAVVNTEIKNVANIGIVTVELEKPAELSAFVHNAPLQIQSTFTIGGSVTIPLSLVNGYLAW